MYLVRHVRCRLVVALMILGSIAATGCSGGEDEAAAEREGADTSAAASAGTASEGDASCGPVSPRQEVVLSLSNLANFNFSHVLVADETGAFEEEGLDVEITTAGLSDALAPMNAGTIDVQLSSVSVQALNAMAEGLDIRWVAPGWFTHEDSRQGVWVRSSMVLPDGSLDRDELEGSTWGSANFSVPMAMLLAPELQDAGLGFDAIQTVSLSSSDRLVALLNGSIDGGFMSSPQYTELIDNPDFTYVGGFRTDPEVNGTAWFAGPGLLERPEVGSAFFRAIMRTLQEHYAGTDYMEDPSFLDMVSNLTDLPMESVEQLASQPPEIFNAELPLDGVDEWLETAQEVLISVEQDTGEELVGFDEPLPTDRFVNTSLVDAARRCVFGG